MTMPDPVLPGTPDSATPQHPRARVASEREDATYRRAFHHEPEPPDAGSTYVDADYLRAVIDGHLEPHFTEDSAYRKGKEYAFRLVKTMLGEVPTYLDRQVSRWEVAWADLTAALPDGCRFQALEQWWDPYEGAYFRAAARWTDDSGKPDVWADDGGRNPSPVRAIQALAAALRESRS